jgi:hypothetical protein
MKKSILTFLVFTLILLSCNQDDKEPQFNILGYWNISLVSETKSSTVISGDQINFSERYIFNDDGTFIKFSTRNSKTNNPLLEPVQALGLYSMKDAEDPNHVFELTLTFETNQEMAATCNDAGVEKLLLTRENRLINSSWDVCDGLVLAYQKNTSKF